MMRVEAGFKASLSVGITSCTDSRTVSFTVVPKPIDNSQDLVAEIVTGMPQHHTAALSCTSEIAKHKHYELLKQRTGLDHVL